MKLFTKYINIFACDTLKNTIHICGALASDKGIESTA
jgi:hypothetical protein